jgi:SagB-type dehydrogenase family enzyme
MDWKRLFAGKLTQDPGAAAALEDEVEQARTVLFAYHDATKHAPQRFARGPGGLDWESQPDPFRRWAGAEVLPLAHPPIGPEPRYEQVFVEGTLVPRPLDRAFVSQLFFDSLALSAWKSTRESRWSLRVNPSSGNLHPTEGYLLAPAVTGLSDTPFLAHYAPEPHALEVRTRFESALWERIARPLPADALLVGLTSIHWRESWKYGERAYRYCSHDVGHAIACVTLAAAGMGWKATMLDGLGAGELGQLLHLGDTHDPEAEEPACLLAIHPQRTHCREPRLDTAPVGELARCEPRGAPSTLSPDHVDWEVVEIAARAARKPPGVLARSQFEPPLPAWTIGDEPIPFRKIVHQRRSAVAMDGRSGLERDAFYQALRRTLPGRGELPFSALPWSPRVHLVLFVHRVQGLEPGLYFLARNPADEVGLRAALRPEFSWSRPPACPPELPLWFLHAADVRGLAARVSCDQEIAADGCFSLGMLARFASSIEEDGPWMYPRLYWECGVVGQVLYLEAEALGLRSTGIGCFYDDAVHAALGLRGRAWQSLYHFSLGGPVDDPRIAREPAYAEPRG